MYSATPCCHTPQNDMLFYRKPHHCLQAQNELERQESFRPWKKAALCSRMLEDQCLKRDTREDGCDSVLLFKKQALNLLDPVVCRFCVVGHLVKSALSGPDRSSRLLLGNQLYGTVTTSYSIHLPTVPSKANREISLMIRKYNDTISISILNPEKRCGTT